MTQQFNASTLPCLLPRPALPAGDAPDTAAGRTCSCPQGFVYINDISGCVGEGGGSWGLGGTLGVAWKDTRVYTGVSWKNMGVGGRHSYLQGCVHLGLGLRRQVLCLRGTQPGCMCARCRVACVADWPPAAACVCMSASVLHPANTCRCLCLHCQWLERAVHQPLCCGTPAEPWQLPKQVQRVRSQQA